MHTKNGLDIREEALSLIRFNLLFLQATDCPFQRHRRIHIDKE